MMKQSYRKIVLAKGYWFKNMHPGLTQEQAVEKANKRKLILVPHSWALKDLVRKFHQNKRLDTYPIWTGTLVAYAGFGRPLEETILYRDPKTKYCYEFEVPVQFQGKKDCVLAINHGFNYDGSPIFEFRRKHAGEPDYIIHVYDKALIKQVNLEGSGSGHIPEKEFGIPVPSGEEVGFSSTLYRLCAPNDPYVGLLSDSIGQTFNADHVHVHMDWPHSDHLGAMTKKWHRQKKAKSRKKADCCGNDNVAEIQQTL